MRSAEPAGTAPSEGAWPTANLTSAEAYFHDRVIDLGASSGPLDLAFGFSLVASDAGGFGVDLAFGGQAVPEFSTWAMLSTGFVTLALAGWRRAARVPAAVTAKG